MVKEKCYFPILLPACFDLLLDVPVLLGPFPPFQILVIKPKTTASKQACASREQIKKNQVFYEKNRIEIQISSDFHSAKAQARENIIKKVEQAKIEYDSIIEEESSALTEIQSKVANTLKEVPTFEVSADFVSASDPAMLRAELADIINGNNNESQALEAARKAMSEMGDKGLF